MSISAISAVEEKARILIVEDEGIIATDIQRTLEGLGYDLAGWATSGAEALGLIAHGAVDLVLMDIRIQGELDGIETAEQIKQSFQIPVIYLTAHTDGPILQRAKLTEPLGYIVKPFTTGDLKLSMEIALDRCRPQREAGRGGNQLVEAERS